MKVSFIFCSFLSKGIILPIPGSRESYCLLKEERVRNEEKPVWDGGGLLSLEGGIGGV